MTELVAVLNECEVGRVRQARGRLSFRYADSWRLAESAYPLSLSMPLAQAEHPHATVETFLWGLLPDNDLVLRRWGRQFGVSDRNPFALLREVGEDCAGAIRFIADDRLNDDRSGTITWLTEDDVGERLRLLRDDAASERLSGDIAQFSLAGAQPKTALLFDGQRWGVPSGRIPTTHILKPALPNFDGHVENLNWLIGGSDAHAKNYSLLLGRGGIVRLAPLYDVASVLVYPGIDPLKVRMAMSIGGEYRLERISLPQWVHLATACRLDSGALMTRIVEMAATLPDLLSDEIRRARATGLDHPILDRMMEILPARARRCERIAA